MKIHILKLGLLHKEKLITYILKLGLLHKEKPLRHSQTNIFSSKAQNPPMLLPKNTDAAAQKSKGT